MEIECENCGTRLAVTLGDGIPLCEECAQKETETRGTDS